jgi:NAD+ kinase
MSAQRSKKKIAIVYRLDRGPAVNLALTITQWLNERHYAVFTAPEQKKLKGTRLATSRDMKTVSLVLVMGGDGTYLRAIRILKGLPIPILGINLGSLGFLTPIRVDEALTAVEFALQGRMSLEPRSMIAMEILRKGATKTTKNPAPDFLALNDIVIERGNLSQLINIGIYHERMLLSEVKADGLIIASPTGSTAYNLAAGGPILHPQVRAFVVTPIAPHSLTSRPLIVPDKGPLSFRLVGKLQKARLVVDGQKVAELGNDDEVVLRRSPLDHFMLTDRDHDYFRLLREKLKFGDRA